MSTTPSVVDPVAFQMNSSPDKKVKCLPCRGSWAIALFAVTIGVTS
jgi:hypothetical protein